MNYQEVKEDKNPSLFAKWICHCGKGNIEEHKSCPYCGRLRQKWDEDGK